jgi:hypothetical protein
VIAVNDATIGSEAASVHGTPLLAAARLNKGDRPATIVFNLNGQEVVEESFAGLIFDNVKGSLVPSVEVVQWQSLFLVLGIRRWLIFKNAPIKQCRTLDLHRAASDDTGFYATEFQAYEELLMGIYEGGSVCISPSGEIMWHIEKYWDDIFLGIEESSLVFMIEGGARYAIDCKTGKKIYIK